MTGDGGCDCYLGLASAEFMMPPGAAPSLSRGRRATEQMLPQPHLEAVTWHRKWLTGLGWPGRTRPPTVAGTEEA